MNTSLMDTSLLFQQLEISARDLGAQRDRLATKGVAITDEALLAMISAARPIPAAPDAATMRTPPKREIKLSKKEQIVATKKGGHQINLILLAGVQGAENWRGRIRAVLEEARKPMRSPDIARLMYPLLPDALRKDYTQNSLRQKIATELHRVHSRAQDAGEKPEFLRRGKAWLLDRSASEQGAKAVAMNGAA